MKGKISVGQVSKFAKYLFIIFCILAFCLVSYILFKYPQPGVADQGDFNRVMIATGLKLTPETKADSDITKFYDYIITEFEIPIKGHLRTLPAAAYTSLAYVISIATFLCKSLGQHVLKTDYLAVIYCLLYTFSIIIIIRYLNIKSKSILVLITLLSLFIFYDGNYLVWFNSLYGEPMMITSLLLYTAAWVYYLYYKNTINSTKGVFVRTLFIFAAAFLLIGSKMQTISALPVILLLQFKSLRENRRLLNHIQLYTSILLMILLIEYPFQISLANKSLSMDTQYNSVFFGILKNSKNPSQDLVDMGLNPDMAVEAGKHSYLDKSAYVKYAPHSEVTKKEFYSKMSNGKLIKFYLTHPLRLVQGMEYTAKHAFYTNTNLGKYTKDYSVKPIRDFHRFTLWSDLKSALMPRNLIFIVLFYMISFLASLFIYLKCKGNREIKDKILLFWGFLSISMLQFPMPFVGNGQADTAKQLFLFNFIFDMIVIVFFCMTFYSLSKLAELRKNNAYYLLKRLLNLMKNIKQKFIHAKKQLFS